MNKLKVFCRNIYGHNAGKIDYLSGICSDYNVICVQEHLLTKDNFALFQSFPRKSVFMHEAKRQFTRGRPSGGTAVLVDDQIPCRLYKSCDYYTSVEFVGPSNFFLINVYLPTNLNNDRSEKRYAEACSRLSRLLCGIGKRRLLICGDFQCNPIYLVN